MFLFSDHSNLNSTCGTLWDSPKTTGGFSGKAIDPTNLCHLFGWLCIERPCVRSRGLMWGSGSGRASHSDLSHSLLCPANHPLHHQPELIPCSIWHAAGFWSAYVQHVLVLNWQQCVPCTYIRHVLYRAFATLGTEGGLALRVQDRTVRQYRFRYGCYISTSHQMILWLADLIATKRYDCRRGPHLIQGPILYNFPALMQL